MEGCARQRFEIEVTARLARLRPFVNDVGISYKGGTYQEGKMIGREDGMRAFHAVVKYNLFAK